MTGDIWNEYLNANTEENIYASAGAEFELVDIMSEKTLLEVVNTLYVLPTIGNRWHAHLSHTLREMSLRKLVFTRMSGVWGAGEDTIILVHKPMVSLC